MIVLYKRLILTKEKTMDDRQKLKKSASVTIS